MVKKYHKVWVDEEGYIHTIDVKYYKRGKYITDQRFYDFFDAESVTAFMHNVANSILVEYEDDKERKRLAYAIAKRYFKKAEKEQNKILKRSYLRVARFFWRLYNTPSKNWSDVMLE